MHLRAPRWQGRQEHGWPLRRTTGKPAETSKFFHHSVPISSHNALCRLLEAYDQPDQHGLHVNGYQGLLEKTRSFFLVITDDGISCSTTVDGKNYSFLDSNQVAPGQQVATDWDVAIRGRDPEQFGIDEMNRKYTFWSVISQRGYKKANPNDYGVPLPSTEPVTTQECIPNGSDGTPVDPGTGYQALSILTEGYRYPTCALDYTEIFKLMAQGVIEGAVAPCEFELPKPPEGETLDPSTIEIVYKPGDGGPDVTFLQVASPSNCSPTGFYIDGEVIKLCPEACALVKRRQGE